MVLFKDRLKICSCNFLLRKKNRKEKKNEAVGSIIFGSIFSIYRASILYYWLALFTHLTIIFPSEMHKFCVCASSFALNTESGTS